MATCPGCRTRLHVGCRRELGACSTLGCPEGQRPARALERAPSQARLLEACASAALLGWAVAELQELLLTRHTHTPSDVVAVTLCALLATPALGIGWVRGSATRGSTQALGLAAYLGTGLAGSSSAIHRGVWLASGLLLLVALVRGWVRPARGGPRPSLPR